MNRRHLNAALALLLGLSAAPLAACGPSTPQAKMANVPVGSLPAGETFKGVWFNPVWGELHLVPTADKVVGAWKSASSGVWGKLEGTISGDVIKFEWTEHKAGAIGPGSVRKGKGYFKFKATEAPNPPEMTGEWGNGESEVGGGGWDCKKERDVEPKLDSVKGDEDPSVDTGWDSAPATPGKK